MPLINITIIVAIHKFLTVLIKYIFNILALSSTLEWYPFNDFFYYTNWKYSSDKGEKYITANGCTEYNDEKIEIGVKFKIKGDMYPIDSVYVNGKKIDTKYNFDILTIIFKGYQ